jgi:hypothetical protein
MRAILPSARSKSAGKVSEAVTRVPFLRRVFMGALLVMGNWGTRLGGGLEEEGSQEAGEAVGAGGVAEGKESGNGGGQGGMARRGTLLEKGHEHGMPRGSAFAANGGLDVSRGESRGSRRRHGLGDDGTEVLRSRTIESGPGREAGADGKVVAGGGETAA